MASNLLQLGPEEEEEEKGFDLDKGAVGVTEEVVAFVRDITMHPETWLDFPLPETEDDEGAFTFIFIYVFAFILNSLKCFQCIIDCDSTGLSLESHFGW